MTPPASALPLNRAGLTRRVPARLGAIGIAVAIVLVLLAPAGRSTLWDRDEPRFARATLEMLGAHRLLYPTFNGEVRAQKPILVYWLMALSVTALGPTETAFRLWSPVGIAIAALCTFAIGRRFLSGPGALAAMGVMAFSPLAIVEGSLATTDAVLLGATTAAITAFVGLAHQPTWRMTVALAGSLSVALLTKGPVGLVVPLAVMGACIGLGWPANRRAVLRRVAIGSAVSIIAYAAWLVPATVATSGAFLSVGIWRDNVGRALAPMEGHGGSVLSYLPYYPLVMLLAFLPWSLALPVALRRVGRGMHGPELRALVFAWIFAPLVLFTLVATKLPHYILPVWPALGLAVGATLDAVRTEDLSDQDHRWLAAAAGVYGVVGSTLCVALLVAAAVVPLEGLRVPLVAIATVTLVVAGASVLAIRRRRVRLGGAWLLGGVLSGHLLIGGWVLPALEAAKPVPHLARIIQERVPPDVQVSAYGVGAPSLDFYVDRPTIRRLTSDDEVRRWLRQDGAGALVIHRAALDRLTSAAEPSSLVELASASGLDYTRGRVVDLVVVTK